jgi:cytochrome c oxidase assembly factor CtaG
MFEDLEIKQVMNVLLSIIIASCIIILVTRNMMDKNGLSALIGGYYGLFLGMLFIIIVNLVFSRTTYLDMFPIFMIIVIVALLIYYLTIYFDRIATGEVSSYYSTFSFLSVLFLFTQIIIVLNSIYNKQEGEENAKLFKNTTFSLLGLFSVINFIAVINLGIVLRFYSTQG